uniref:Uncharacterized protein n=1 Tax=Oryza glumipatula TaxID=40148 RepID=A0A0D9Z990_9ORYZ
MGYGPTQHILQRMEDNMMYPIKDQETMLVVAMDMNRQQDTGYRIEIQVSGLSGARCSLVMYVFDVRDSTSAHPKRSLGRRRRLVAAVDWYAYFREHMKDTNMTLAQFP